jgi:hypothetical protein
MPDRATQIRDDLGAPARVGQKWLNERRVKASGRPLAFGAGGAIVLNVMFDFCRAAPAVWRTERVLRRAGVRILRATLMTAEWPFDQPRNCAIITLKSITSGERPILLVTHDLEDHGWQFLDGHDVDESDATIIGFARIVELDASLLELADLPPGWCAWRASPTDP